jgi:hypothetical protein
MFMNFNTGVLKYFVGTEIRFDLRNRFSGLALSHFSRARILKHLLEAEKSTFRIKLSFQRSESTTGLLQATIFVNYRKDSFL